MTEGFPGGSDGKGSVCNVGDPGLIPGSGRPTGKGNGNLLQHSYLENPMDSGEWQATVHGTAKSQMQLRYRCYIFFSHSSAGRHLDCFCTLTSLLSCNEHENSGLCEIVI